MGDFQNIATVILALVVGFIIGRSSKKITIRRDPERLTPEEWASLQPDTEHNPYDDVHPDVLNALNASNKIEAIKLFRQYHSASLKEAKHAIDAIFKNFR
jgi:ribosomal protein L7/L12